MKRLLSLTACLRSAPSTFFDGVTQTCKDMVPGGQNSPRPMEHVGFCSVCLANVDLNDKEHGYMDNWFIPIRECASLSGGYCLAE